MGVWHRADAQERLVTISLLWERGRETQSFSNPASWVPKLCPQHPRTPVVAGEPRAEQAPTSRQQQQCSGRHTPVPLHLAQNQQAPVTSQLPEGPPGPCFRVEGRKWAPRGHEAGAE